MDVTQKPKLTRAHVRLPPRSCSQELLLQTNRIKEKATQSEAIVRDITRDIQTLDKGKKNLMASITILKRLQMLGELAPPQPDWWTTPTWANRLALSCPSVTALSQLESLIPTKRYREIASSLAVRPGRLLPLRP